MEIYSLVAITCSKLSVETIDQGVRYAQISNKDTRMMSMTAV